jgi:uncharacterized protein DUF4407
MSKLKKFFWYCSGSNIQILEKCPTDGSKYVGIGASVLFTGLFAMLASGYAIYTFTASYWSSILVGLLWGLMIFNLDRFIVSSMRKTGNKRNEFIMALPRIILAILISVVISRPLELKVFEREIETELTLINAEIKETQIDQLRTKAEAEIESLQKENESIASVTSEKENSRDQLREIASQEADGTGGSMERNAGPIYKIKKADADKVETELSSLRTRNDQIITGNLASIDSIRSRLTVQIAKLDEPNYTGLAARLEALDRISVKSAAIWMANWFIILLFIAIETAPVFVKLISYKGPYDHLLAQEEHGFETKWLEFVAKANKVTRKKAERADDEEEEYVNEQLSTRLNS